MWMMVLVFSMQIGGNFAEVAQVKIVNFANQADCEAKRATVLYSLPSQFGVHNATIVCQPQSR